ncbi:MAG: cupin domain-containing protein [Gemmatimonadaceae bacterium]
MSDSDELALLHLLAQSSAGAASAPASLRERILHDARATSFTFLAAGEGIWLPGPVPGVSIKALFLESHDRLTTRLVRLSAGSSMPGPLIAGCRAQYVIEGSLRDAHASTAALAAGDFADERDLARPAGWVAEHDALVIEFAQRDGRSSPPELRRSGEATWHDAVPGGRVRALAGAHHSPREVLVLDMSPDSTLGGHEHHGVEEVFVLGGSCVIEGRHMDVGDYHRAASQSTHGETRALGLGCLLLVSVRDAARLAATAGAP